MEKNVLCEIEDCHNTAMLRWNGLLVCGPCIDVMASMNGENEQVLREVVRTASPLAEGEWKCGCCGEQSDSFHVLNGVCLDCRSVMPYAWEQKWLSIALARSPVGSVRGAMKGGLIWERLKQACEKAGFELFILAPSLLLILAGDDVCYYGESSRGLEQQDIDEALEDVLGSMGDG